MADGTFAQALQGKPVAEILDPRTGELFDVATADHADLVEIFLALRDAEKRYAEWRKAAEAELVARHGEGEGAQPVGDWTIEIERSLARQWDPEELELVCVDLVDRGNLSLFDISGLISSVRKVDGHRALDLLNRGDEETGRELRRCFTWKKGPPHVKVTDLS